MVRPKRMGATVLIGIFTSMLPAAGVGAAEITVLSAVAMKPALDDLAREFERRTGHTVKVGYATAGVVSRSHRGR